MNKKKKKRKERKRKGKKKRKEKKEETTNTFNEPNYPRLFPFPFFLPSADKHSPPIYFIFTPSLSLSLPLSLAILLSSILSHSPLPPTFPSTHHHRIHSLSSPSFLAHYRGSASCFTWFCPSHRRGSVSHLLRFASLSNASCFFLRLGTSTMVVGDFVLAL